MKKLYLGIVTIVVAMGLFTGCIVKYDTAKTVKDEVNKNEKVEYIGEETAKKIALDKAELKENEVNFIKVEFERDDGVYFYDVEFRKDRVEYSAEIKADDGKILEWDVDLDD